jgi:hypothetical protein
VIFSPNDVNFLKSQQARNGAQAPFFVLGSRKLREKIGQNKTFGYKNRIFYSLGFGMSVL